MVDVRRLFPDVIKWDVLFYMSIGFFALIIVMLFINPLASTVLTFALIGFWSRIPCHIGYHTKDLEMIDFLSVVIGINMGPLAGGAFAFSLIWVSAAYGKIEPPAHTWASSLAMLAGAIAAPFLYTYFGGNLLFALYGFTVVRYAVGYSTVALTTPALLFDEITAFVPCIVSAYVTNTIYVAVFGDYFGEKLVAQGMQLDWQLIFVMGIVLAVITIIKFREPFAKKMETNLVMKESDVKEERPSWQEYA